MFDNMAGAMFVPAHDLILWAYETFIGADGELVNEDHAHLRFAAIGMLWTNVGNARQGRRILGQAEPGTPRAMGKWAKARAELQVLQWFPAIPDFIITLDAGYAATCDDDSFCALVEHELYHCGQERDEFGNPKFRNTGAPAFGMRGHDVEEFVGVVRRYGADAAGVTDLITAASSPPQVARTRIAHACGTCG